MKTLILTFYIIMNIYSKYIFRLNCNWYNLRPYKEISKIAHLNWWRNFKIIFGKHTFPTRFFWSVLTSRTMPNSWTRKNKIVFFFEIFSFFASFYTFFFSSTQSQFGCYKRELKHCTPPIMVSLSTSTPTVTILIREWCIICRTNQKFIYG